MHSLIKELRDLQGRGRMSSNTYQAFKKLFDENDDLFFVLEEDTHAVDSSIMAKGPMELAMDVHVVEIITYEVHDKMTTDKPKAYFRLEMGHNLGIDPKVYSTFRLAEVEPIVLEERKFREVAN